MIYSSDIGISVLGSPLTFTLPKDYKFYHEQMEYIPMLHINHYIQILISQTLYNSVDDLKLKMHDINGVVLDSFTFNKKILSTAKYYADTTLIIGTNTGLAYFTIYDGDNKLADSIIYRINATYKELHKTIQYTNKRNDYNTVFINSDNSINRFELSIECGFKGDSLDVVDNSEDYLNQNMNNNRVFSRPYDTEKLIIGSGRGIPPYLFRKISRIFACSNLVIGGIPFRVANGEKLEKENVGVGGLGIYSIKVQEINNYLENDFYTGNIFSNEFNDIFS